MPLTSNPDRPVASVSPVSSRRQRLVAEDELLLRLARLARHREHDASRIAVLVEAVEPGTLVSALQRQRLLPLFGQRVLGAAAIPPPSILSESIAAAIDSARHLGRMQEIALSGVLDSLAQAGIRAATLKGPRLAQTLYGDLGLRQASDLDVLVEVDSLAHAIEVVRGLGWLPPEDVIGHAGLPLLHFAMRHPGGLPSVELHWRVHWYEERFAQDALDRGTEAPGGLRLDAQDAFAFQLLFAARDAFSGLRLTVDAIGWLELYGLDILNAVPDIESEYPALSRALSAAASQVLRIAGLEGEGLIAEESLRTRISWRLGDPLQRLSPKQSWAERGLIDILVAPPGGAAAAIRRQVLPSTVILQQRARQPGAATMQPVTTSSHAVRTLRRYLAAPFVRVRRPTQPGRLAS